MNGTLTSDAAAAICRHMNDDHADAIATYARIYAKINPVQSAEMIAIDDHGMDLAVDTGIERIVARVAFDHVLADSSDARDTLIKMARQTAL